MAVKVQQITKGALLAKMRRQIRTFERRYEVSSEEMLSQLRSNRVRETGEIGRWMQTYTVLKKLSETGTAGTPSKTTPRSMNAG